MTSDEAPRPAPSATPDGPLYPVSRRQRENELEPLVEATLALWQRMGKRLRFQAKGQSMWPLIQAGDWLEIELGPGGFQRGDIIVYRSAEQLVAHRLIGQDRRTGAWLVKGDNVPWPDEAFTKEQAVGRVRRVERAGRSIPLDTPLARCCGWLIAMIASMGLELRRSTWPIRRKLARIPCWPRASHCAVRAAQRIYRALIQIASWLLRRA
ncbi:MAG: S24/S26 family peptidase [Chloroflexi bacterium]|nr:S24/S26 family peptidase [Chloroflexota bacterium]